MKQELLTIGQVAAKLGVSIDTLRRWDAGGKLNAIRFGKGGHRRYNRRDIETLLKNFFVLAQNWASGELPQEPEKDFYCPNAAIFQARLQRFESDLMKFDDLKSTFSLISAIAGEIGNNSFDHNLGNWPDIGGIFFAYDINKRMLVLADRGIGILKTLKRVKPEIRDHQEALNVAFTQVITGRAPEHRGNGLKFVKQIIEEYGFCLVFQTGDAKIILQKNHNNLQIQESEMNLRGCLALLTF